MQVFLIAMVTLVLSLVLTGTVRALTLRYQILDKPNTRSSHSIPTPRGGGIAVIAAAGLGMALGSRAGLIDSDVALTLGCGMAALGVVGWLDDRRGVPVAVRLVIHIGVALWTLYMLGGLPGVRFGEATIALGATGYLLGTVGIVWSINLFNFMDGIDGLAGSQAVLIFGAAALLLFALGNRSVGAVAVALAAASLGFLVWNWPPAKIFLGDSGSGSLGYLIAGIAIASENRGAVPLVAFAILGGVFIIDATVTLTRRIIRGESPGDAHRSHAYQRLTRAYGRHLPISTGAAAITLALAGLAALGTLTPALLTTSFVVAYSLLAMGYVAAERRAPM